MRRAARWLAATLFAGAIATAVHGEPLTLERIMADPDWIGPPVERPYWAVDGAAVLYTLKRTGSPVHDLWRVAAGGGAPHRVEAGERPGLDAAQPVFDRDRLRAAFVRNGDVFVREMKTRRLVQVTRTPAAETSPLAVDVPSVRLRS